MRSDRTGQTYLVYADPDVMDYLKGQIILRIKYCLEELLGITLRQLSETTGIAESIIYRQIYYKKPVETTTYFKICSGLKITIGELLSVNDTGIFDSKKYEEWKIAYVNKEEEKERSNKRGKGRPKKETIAAEG